MGCLGATVYFTTPPTAAALVAALNEYTGETVHYEESWRLSCPATNDADGFEATRHLRQHIIEPLSGWYLLNPNLKGGYLWFATLVVLQQLGGACDWKIPSWGFKPWAQAQQEYKRLLVRYYTLDEARRLGVE